MNNWLILVPFLAAALGWLIHGFVIKLIFKPVSLGPLQIKGLIPAHRQALAEGIGQYAAQNLSMDMLTSKIADPALLARLTPVIESHIDHFLKEKLTAELPMISMFIGDKTIGKVKGALMSEIEELLPTLLKNYAANLADEVDIRKIVSEKLASIDPKTLETIVIEKAAGQIRQFKMLGAVVGFLGGLLQLALTALLA
jgi:uncharacterized membrane protein YheB (UPF0754 family)